MEYTAEQIAEIKEHLEAGKPLEEIVKPFAEAGLIFRKKTDEDAYKTNLQKQLEEEADKKVFTRAQSEAYNKIEEKVLEATGLPKESNEPTSEYVVRAYSVKLSELQDKKDDGTASKEEKDLIKQLQAKLAEKDEEINKTKSEYTTKFQQKAFDTDVDKLFAQEQRNKLKKDVDKNVMSELSDARLQRIKAMPKRFNAEGKVEFLDTNGEVIRNANLAPKSINEILEDTFKDLHHVDTKKEGTGSEGKKNDDSTFNYGGITTKEDLSNALLKAGHLRGSEKYNELYREGRKKLNLS